MQLESEYRERTLSLQKLLYFVRPTMHIFEILAGICSQLDKYDDVYGANLLTFLYEKITSLTGDLNSQRIVIHLTKLTAAPYINMLRLWMLKGTKKLHILHQNLVVILFDKIYRCNNRPTGRIYGQGQ